VDKTGTQTDGRPVLLSIAPASDLDEATLLTLAAALEQGSDHPIARALTEAARQRGLALPPVQAFSNLPGEGVAGEVAGRRLRLLAAEAVSDHGGTEVGLHEDGRALGRLHLADRLRPTSAGAVARLDRAGIKAVMLTGDNEAAAAAIAGEAGIRDFRARVRPQDKAAAVAALRGEGRVVGMAGDGINDAPALASADVSFAMAAGTDIALEAADITLMHNDLNAVADAVLLSRAVMAKIRQNLFFAFFYNVLALPLAAAGLLNPVIAGAAMALSSVSVVTNSLRLRAWRPPPGD
jgi:Cu+-exporting ATPase